MLSEVNLLEVCNHYALCCGMQMEIYFSRLEEFISNDAFSLPLIKPGCFQGLILGKK